MKKIYPQPYSSISPLVALRHSAVTFKVGHNSSPPAPTTRDLRPSGGCCFSHLAPCLAKATHKLSQDLCGGQGKLLILLDVLLEPCWTQQRLHVLATVNNTHTQLLRGQLEYSDKCHWGWRGHARCTLLLFIFIGSVPTEQGAFSSRTQNSQFQYQN